LSQDTVTVHIKFRDVEQTFTGDVEQVWASINRFFSEFIPSFELARKIALTIDLQRLIEDVEGIIAIAPEGPMILVPRDKTTDSENLILNLLAAHIGYRLGKLPDETLTREELRMRLGKSPKIVSTRLGELCREGLVAKTSEGKYRITTFGIKRLREEVLPRLRSRI